MFICKYYYNMVFSSILFLIYFLPIFLVVYYVTPQRFRNGFLLLSSVVFYSWGAPRFIFVILGTTIIDFVLVRLMDRTANNWRRRLFLLLSVSINLGLLFYFKYSNFFVENINEVLGSIGMNRISWIKLVLPIGISFYTFETITYVVDVYRKVHKPQPNFWNYQLYIIFFPKLIAGPIVRYHEFADQIKKRYYTDNTSNRVAGFTRFSLGLGKKVLLANPCGSLADQIMGYDLNALNSPLAWVGILAYTMQIYFDFSGYSDMAIGISRMMGFRLPENFNSPYTSKSITEFWRRWHITLGSWMRNYLYIPLGGSHVKSSRRLYFNLFIVFLASGFWHGASWNFLFWGVFHGFFLVIERAFLLKIYERTTAWITIPINFFVVMIGWVFFRLESFDEASVFVSRLFAMKAGSLQLVALDSLVYLIIALVFSFVTLLNLGKRLENLFYLPTSENVWLNGWLLSTSIVLFLVSVSAITSVGFNPFIYFRF
jgi:alginate O-acetyltransferase complex protein AlgI